jgi:signal transduction histidine kinase
VTEPVVGARPRGGDGGATSPDAVAALWLAALQRITASGAHEVKNSLNGVYVNLDVVRRRLARADVEPSAVTRFADVAAEQLDAVTARVDALLALGRSPHAPLDVGTTLARLALLLQDPGEGVVIVVEDTPPSAALTGADAEVARLALAAALLSMVRPGRTVRCWVEASREGIDVRIAPEEVGAVGPEGTVTNGTPTLPPALAELAARVGVRAVVADGILTVSFPPAH